jgi:hypothetical protein
MTSTQWQNLGNDVSLGYNYSFYKGAILAIAIFGTANVSTFPTY